MAITVGKPAPEFALPSSDGTTQTLASLRGSLVVVYFYPRDNTPGCTIEAEAFRDAAPLTAAEAATIILDGVKAGTWRILVGDDARVLDELVREHPEEAYDERFVERLRERQILGFAT